MSKAKFDAARELIAEKRYDEARAILNTINHPTAKEWLTKLDKLSPLVSPSQQLQASTVRKRRSPWWMVIIVFACLGITVIYTMSRNPSQTPTDNAANPSESVAQAVPSDTSSEEQGFASPGPTATITDTPLPSETPLPTETQIPTATPSPVPTVAPIRFDSTTQGMQPVLGPLMLPSGVYRVTVRTVGFFIAQLDTVSGTCEAGFMGLFNLSSGIANNGASSLLLSDDCNALIAISNVTESWTLDFQQITASSPRIDRLNFDSGTEGLQPVIGPLVLSSGTYRVRVVTNGFFIASIETLSGTCDAGFMGLFNLSAGQASNGAEAIFKSKDCLALVTISNVTEPWTLNFEPLA
jgi:hypothetical protein